MITALFAALALHINPAPDAATATLELSRQCLAVMTGDAEAPTGSSRITLADGREATVTVGRDGCTLTVEDWRDDGGVFATGVRDGLLAHSRHWTVGQWRELKVTESGPALWSAIVFPDIRRHSAYWMQIIEPQPGAPERLEVSFGIGP